MYLQQDKDKFILSLTGQAIDPVAKKIGMLLDMKVVNGFDTMPADDKILCVVVNCGGSLRCGLYPKKRINTVNILPTGAVGPLAQYIKDDIYISDVRTENVSASENNAPAHDVFPQNNTESEIQPESVAKDKKNVFTLMTAFATGVGNFVSLLFSAARESVELAIKNVIPFMAFISVLIAIVQETAIGQITANALTPLAGSMFGLFVIAIICGLPFISPVIAPGAAIAQVVGVLIGTLIGTGQISPIMAIPALFAINVQVGADFIPVGLSMQDAKEKTIRLGVPAFLLSRMITAPVGVAVGWLFTIGL